MEQSASTSNLKTKQLFLKKSIVVKFIAKNGLKNEFGRNGTETTTSLTIPTTTINTNPC